MTTDQPRPLQFSLKGLFALIAIAGAYLWLLPTFYRSACGNGELAATLYGLVGSAQLAGAATVFWQGRSTGPGYNGHRELALLDAFLTLGTWLLMMAGLGAGWLGIQIAEPGLLARLLLLPLVMMVIGVHFPIFLLHPLGLLAVHRRGGERRLYALFLLNLTNSLMVLTVIAAFVHALGEFPHHE